MTPEVKPLIHVGDRILEINGISVQNIPPDEVCPSLDKAHVPYNTYTCNICFKCVTSEQLDLVIHDTEHWLQITIEHDPKDLTKHADLSGLMGEELDQPGTLGFFPLPSSRQTGIRSRHIL